MLLLEDESLVHILPDLWPLLLPRNLPNKIADRPKELGSDILSRQVTPQDLEQSLREETVLAVAFQGLQTRPRRVPDKKTRFRGIAEFHLCEQGTVNRELSRISNWFLFTGFLIHDNALLRGSDGTLCRILSEEEVCMGIWLHLLWR